MPVTSEGRVALYLQDKHPIREGMTYVALAEETFKIASTHLSETEVVTRIQSWIKDDRASFLLEALENPATTILDLSATLGVDILMLGSPQRRSLVNLLKGNVVTEVARHLPENIQLVIHG